MITRHTISSLGEAQCGDVNFNQMVNANDFPSAAMVRVRCISRARFDSALPLQGEANVRVGTSFDNKTDQWLGTSIAANDDNIIVSHGLVWDDGSETGVCFVRQAGSPFLKHRINDGHSLEYEIPGGAMIGKYDRSSTMTNSTQIYSPSFLNWRTLLRQEILDWREEVCASSRFAKLQSGRLWSLRFSSDAQ